MLSRVFHSQPECVSSQGDLSYRVPTDPGSQGKSGNFIGGLGKITCIIYQDYTTVVISLLIVMSYFGLDFLIYGILLCINWKC